MRILLLADAASADAPQGAWVEQMLREWRLRHPQRGRAPWEVRVVDARSFGAAQPPQPADVHVHCGVPCRAAWPWARVNVVVALGPGAGWAPGGAWAWAPAAADLFVVPDGAGVAKGEGRGGVCVVPAAAASGVGTAVPAEYRAAWRGVCARLASILRSAAAPPALAAMVPAAVAAPLTAILTLTHNRAAWWPNMLRNVLAQTGSVPAHRLLWVVVDDSPDAAQAAALDARVAAFQAEHSEGPRLLFLRLPPRTPVADKRNAGVEAALAAGAEVVAVMDDDDHYPPGSVAARLAWLRATKKGCAYCATLLLYDAARCISAVSVPPLDLPPAARVSEASLAFTADFFRAGSGFAPGVRVAEGEGFLAGREAQTVEVPPGGVLVAISHGRNATSRAVPADARPNGCHWGFSDEYFTLLDGLAGGTVGSLA